MKPSLEDIVLSRDRDLRNRIALLVFVAALLCLACVACGMSPTEPARVATVATPAPDPTPTPRWLGDPPPTPTPGVRPTPTAAPDICPPGYVYEAYVGCQWPIGQGPTPTPRPGT